MINQIKAAMRSGMGCVRSNNEDAYYFSGQFSTLKNINQETALQGVFSLNGSLFAVSDGIGGAYQGEVASTTTVAEMVKLQEMLKTKSFSETITPWTRDVNRIVTKTVPGGGCTIAMVYVKEDVLYIAHIGDSRVYRLHDDQLISMTKDHSKVQMLMDAGILTPEEASAHPHRHMVVRYIGIDEEENGICAPTVARTIPLVNSDRYLICTDGVTDMIDNATLEKLLKQKTDTNACADAIYHQALAAGGKDNTSLIVLDIEVSELSTSIQKTGTDEDDELETTLDGHKTPIPVKVSTDIPNKMSVTHIYQLPDNLEKKLTIRSEISIQS